MTFKYIEKVDFDSAGIVDIFLSQWPNNCFRHQDKYFQTSYSELVSRVNHEEPEAQKEERLKELDRRVQRNIELHGAKMNFPQFRFSPEVQQQFTALLPESLKNLRHTYTVQYSTVGECLIPHMDHGRYCSLFWLLNPTDCVTRFWHTTRETEIWDKLQYPDPDDLECVHEITMESRTWYLFDQKVIHSAHLIPGKTLNRVSFCIEFHQPAEEIFEILNHK